MGKKTYGDFPGVAVSIDGGSVSDPIGELKDSSIRLWGHNITLEDDTSIKCKMCEKEEEIPELLSMSSGFREVVYKMYILGQFRDEACAPEGEGLEDMLGKRGTKDWPDRATHRVHYDKIHWSKTTSGHNSGSGDTVDMYIPQGERVTLDGTTYTYWGDGTWLDEGDSVGYSTVDLFELHGSSAESTFPKEIVHEKKGMLKRRQDMMDKQSLDTVGIGDLQDAGVGTGPIQTDTVTNRSIDADATDLNAAERLARGLQDKAGHFLTR